MKTLWPPLDIIEQDLFGPQGVGDEGATQSHWDEPALQEEPSTEGAIDLGAEPDELPAVIREAIQRRQTAQAANFGSEPAAGRIVVVQNPGEGGGYPLRPLAVLLVEPAGQDSWSGYMVASETDYASDWDIVLQEAEDGTFDPLAGMIQIWNPMRVRVKGPVTVLAELAPSRLAAVNLWAAEFEQSRPTLLSNPQPGRVGVREIGDTRIAVGTPLGGADDPRWAYQRI